MRVGQKDKLTYRWARKGSRPRVTHDQRTQSTHLFGAVCPERGAGAALAAGLQQRSAWNTLIDQPWKIMSVARCDWASVGYSM